MESRWADNWAALRWEQSVKLLQGFSFVKYLCLQGHRLMLNNPGSRCLRCDGRHEMLTDGNARDDAQEKESVYVVF